MIHLAVIPARFGASRFPGKPLAPLLGRPMVEHVYRRCQEAGCFTRVLVATDDERIAQAVAGFGGEAVMTSSAHASGTDRLAEVAQKVSADVYFNVQGDEPAVHPASLRALRALFDAPEVQMATLVRPLEEAERGNPNVVKAVLDERGDALYFSRSEVPFPRAEAAGLRRWAHLGLYGYRRETLLRLAALAPTALERAESLEQLRALEHGLPIRVLTGARPSWGVDTAEDAAAVAARLADESDSGGHR
jgi:3-deoxy-manno-octulosonate cytidylyltransferase (CMP-KDO synthetase)